MTSFWRSCQKIKYGSSTDGPLRRHRFPEFAIFSHHHGQLRRLPAILLQSPVARWSGILTAMLGSNGRCFVLIHLGMPRFSEWTALPLSTLRSFVSFFKAGGVAVS